MFSHIQKKILTKNNILVNWQFKITDQTGKFYYFSNREVIKYEGARNVGYSLIGACYTEKERFYDNAIINFSGITLRRNSSELNMQTPDDLEFELDNSTGILDTNGPEGSIFAGGTVLLKLQLNNIDFYSWKFKITRADFSQEKTIKIKCKDFLQYICDKTYPSKYIIDIFGQSASRGNEEATIPVFIGKGYLPLTPVYFEDTETTLYLLGPAEYTYTIHKARSPRSYSGSKLEYEFFGQETRTGNDGIDYKFVFATAEHSGTAEDNALWQNGDRLYDMPFQVSRSDTADLTNPADWIEFVLKDMGVDEVDIGDWDEAKELFTLRGLEWNGGYYYKQDNSNIIAQLQKSCHAQLNCGEKIGLSPLSVEVLGTIDKSMVLLEGGEAFGNDTFVAESIEYLEDADSGYVTYCESDEPPDELLKTLVSAFGSTSNPSSSTLELPFIDNSIHAEKLGKLNYQLLLGKVAEINYTAQPECLEFLPNSVIQVNQNEYGGNYKLMVDEIKISFSLEILMQCIRFSEDIDDWDSIVR